MVSTRSSSVGLAPAPAPEAAASTSKRRAGSAAAAARASASRGDDDDDDDAATPLSPQPSRAKKGAVVASRAPSSTTPAAAAAAATATPAPWSHTPTHLTIIWLAVAIPVVLWDAFFILLRPHTFRGGRLHWPLYVPYGLYQDVDYVYGLPAFEARDGWPSAQGAFNLLETAAYAAYMFVALRRGVDDGPRGRGRAKGGGEARPRAWAWLLERRRVEGTRGAALVLLLFAATAVTLAKTMLYGLIEYYSGFKQIGHNKPIDLLFLWIIPNGLWLVFPSFILYSAAKDILRGLSMAAGVSSPPEKPALL